MCTIRVNRGAVFVGSSMQCMGVDRRYNLLHVLDRRYNLLHVLAAFRQSRA